jgi:hypothetical protein
MKKLIIATTLLAALVSPALASAFWPGTVMNIAPTDTLKARQWPASYSTIVGTYYDGANVSLTGRCKNTVTN